MPFFSRLIARFRAWRASRQHPVLAEVSLVVPPSGPIFREVSANGIRVYSLCGSCGARLEMSATLCSACAKRRSPSSPF